MRMIRWMCGYTKLDRLRNKIIRKSVGVAPIKDKLRKSRLGGLVMLEGGAWMLQLGGVSRFPYQMVGEAWKAKKELERGD